MKPQIGMDVKNIWAIIFMYIYLEPTWGPLFLLEKALLWEVDLQK